MDGDPSLELGGAVVLQFISDASLLFSRQPNEADESLLMELEQV